MKPSPASAAAVVTPSVMLTVSEEVTAGHPRQDEPWHQRLCKSMRNKQTLTLLFIKVSRVIL